MFLPYAQPYPATPRSVNVQFSYNAIAFNPLSSVLVKKRFFFHSIQKKVVRKTLDIKGRL